MRSKIEAYEYKDYILGFIFYKYLSDTEVKYVYEQGGTESIVARVRATRPYTILLVDDLLRTGGTMQQCVSVLRDDPKLSCILQRQKHFTTLKTSRISKS